MFDASTFVGLWWVGLIAGGFNMALTVVTHTSQAYGRDITRCVQSVNAALVDDCRHVVFELPGDNESYIQGRYDAMKLGGWVAFVDDDDWIPPNVLKHCMAAIKANSDVGVVFTRCVQLLPDGSKSLEQECHGYIDVAIRPTALHNIACINTARVTPRALALAKQHGCGIDWTMKAEAALTHGAVHVPTVGYYYDCSHGQSRRSIDPIVTANYGRSMIAIAQTLRTWKIKNGKIPSFKL